MKKLVIALVLAVVVVLSLSVPALAWDVEDPEVANNEDFILGKGNDYFAGWAEECHIGEQDRWGYNDRADGYNLYRDDATDTGNLDRVMVRTLTPDKIGLPYVNDYRWWAVTKDRSPDTWYWAKEPRGYDYPPKEPVKDTVHHINIILPNAHQVVRYHGRSIGPIDFDDGTWRIQISKGTGFGNRPCHLEIDSNGQISNGVTVERGEVLVTRIG